MFGFNFMQVPPSRPFKTQYKCYSFSMMPKGSGARQQHLEKGGKIIMPPSALDQLTRLNIVYPMLFRLTNNSTVKENRTTHCGVLEFVADEGRVYLPYWMMNNLCLSEGGLITVESVILPVGNYAKFQPHSVEFLDMTNPKAVLENRLRHHACLTKGDVIPIFYNDKTFEMSVLELKPSDAVSVIECDLSVEFAPPIGYKEPEYVKKSTAALYHDEDEHDDEDMDLSKYLDVTELLKNASFKPFTGSGNRLDGKSCGDTLTRCDSSVISLDDYVRGIPDYDYEPMTLSFIRWKPPKKNKKTSAGSENPKFEAFKGKGNSLKTSYSRRK